MPQCVKEGGEPIPPAFQLHRRRADGPHLPYPSSPQGRGGKKKKLFLELLFSPLSREADIEIIRTLAGHHGLSPEAGGLVR